MKKTLIFAPFFLMLAYSCSKSPKTPVTSGSSAAVSSFAGNGNAGLVNGVNLGSEFDNPIDLAIDKFGNIYVSDLGNNVIRKVTNGGTVSTYAGNGKTGYKDGDALSAEFNAPEGIVIDDSGNLYVSDSQNNVIRKISSAGIVSTYAGNGTTGLKNGAALSAEFSGPNGLAIDKSKNIYVSDFYNNVIRMISSGGTVSTFAGNGTVGLVDGAALTAEFHSPSGLAIDASGTLFVTESSNKAIRKITSSGDVSTFAAGLIAPVRVVTDGLGNLYVADANFIRKVSSNGTVTPYAGNATAGLTDGKPSSAQFSTPTGLALDAGSDLLIADYGNNVIRLITP